MKRTVLFLVTLTVILTLFSATFMVGASAALVNYVDESMAYLHGDINADEKVMITDATMLQKHLAGLDTLTEEELSRADANTDEGIDIKDVTYIQMVAAGSKEAVNSTEPAQTIPIVQNTLPTPIEPTQPTTAPEPSSEPPVKEPVVHPTYKATQEQICRDFEDKVVDLVNEVRIANGLVPLVKADAPTEVAEIRAEEITFMFAHQRPNGEKFSTVYDEIGVDYAKVGENIASGQLTPEDVMEAWMNSESHRTNILDSKYTKIGAGCYYFDNSYYWVQQFYVSWDD